MDSGSDFLVRAALPADADAIAAVHVAAWRETYAGIMSAEALARLSVERRALRWYQALTESPTTLDVFVAERDGAIVGFAAGGRARDPRLPHDGEIHGIYVLRAGQGVGIGKALMRATAQRLAAAGLRSVYLWVLRENRSARAFYEHLGGVVVAERIEEVAGEPHPELAYGWTEVGALAGPS